jgi:ABC-2 type transport system permease protein
VTGLVRAELHKQRSTTTSLSLLAAMVGLVVLVVSLHGFSLPAHDIASRADQMKVFGWGTVLGSLFAGLLGAISITGEYRHGTIRPTFLITPRRERVIAAKLLTGVLAGVALGVIAEALAAGIASLALSARGIPNGFDAGDVVRMLAGGAGAAALWAALGVGVGALTRNQVVTVIGLCLWVLLIENILLGDLPGVGKFTPDAAAGALSGTAIDNADKLLAPGFAAIVLVAYALALAAAGRTATVRRDIA